MVKCVFCGKQTIMENTCSECLNDGMAFCLICGGKYQIGEDGNELGFCQKCQEKPDFPYDLDAYYEDLDKGKTIFKGFDTKGRGILERYKKFNNQIIKKSNN